MPYLMQDPGAFTSRSPLREKLPNKVARPSVCARNRATYVTNSRFNRVGATFVQDLARNAPGGKRPIALPGLNVIARDA